MPFEKYGIEIEVTQDTVSSKFTKTGEKIVSECEHPTELVIEEDGVKYCQKCQKYLSTGDK